MSKTVLVVLAMIIIPACLFAVDGQVLINMSTVTAAGGFPYKITQSGSYKLSGNLVIPAGKNGIEINADYVVLDLNGFTVSGPGKCNGRYPNPATLCSGNDFSTQGILASGAYVTVKNGSVAGMGVGVYGGALIEEVQANNNLVTGIQVGAAVVRRCTADNNGGTGFRLEGNTLAEANEASLNTSNGMVSFEGTVIGNTLNHNGYDGLAPRRTVYGSNSIQGNSAVDVYLFDTSSVSQNNNICSFGRC
jgi:hypothetical protein